MRSPARAVPRHRLHLLDILREVATHSPRGPERPRQPAARPAGVAAAPAPRHGTCRKNVGDLFTRDPKPDAVVDTITATSSDSDRAARPFSRLPRNSPPGGNAYAFRSQCVGDLRSAGQGQGDGLPALDGGTDLRVVAEDGATLLLAGDGNGE